MAADELGGDRLHHAAEIEQARLFRHARMKDDLQQQVAELLAQIFRRAALDCVGDLVGLFDREGGDGGEGLLDVPGTAGNGIAQRRHDFDKAANVARRLHGRGQHLPIGEAAGRRAAGAHAKAAWPLASRDASERERNGLASFGRIDHSHGDLLTFGEMRNAGWS